MSRIILHVDMDAFFASVEQARRAELRGRPIIVTGAGERTVIMTASYEARAFGIRTGMTVPEAFRHCPFLIRVPADNQVYAKACGEIVSILRKYTPEIQVYSIDEAFLDLTASLSLFGGAEAIAREIKRRILKQLGLTCSIGIAPNKRLAKLASGLVKPNGLTILPPRIIPHLLEETPIEELCGIGGKLKMKLNRIGIRTCGELGRAPISILRSMFGVWGEHLSAMGRGEDPGEVIPEEVAPDPKSIGHTMTLERDIDDRTSIEIFLLQLSEKVGRRLRRGGWAGRVATLTLRDRDFTTHSHQRRLVSPVWESLRVFREIKEIFLDVSLRQPVRLVGVGVGDLVKREDQPSLFPEIDRRERLYKSIDSVNDRHGEYSLTWGTLLERHDHRGVISPAWRPDGIRRYL
jgi:DNA polymerase-4